ncbi:MAG: hypothetical protein ACYC6G_15015 [Desulfobaccales bacterium]
MKDGFQFSVFCGKLFLRTSPMTIIPNVYDKIGSVLREMRSNLGIGVTFTTSEVYKLFVQRYPGDEEMLEKRQMKKPGAHSLKGNLNGLVWEYYKRTDGYDPDRPAIEFLEKMIIASCDNVGRLEGLPYHS